MQVRELALKQDMVMVGAGNVAGAAGTSATLVDRRLHGFHDGFVLAHAEIVVGTPDGHILRAVFSVADRLREVAALALEIGEYAIPAFLVQTIQLVLEKGLEIHSRLHTCTGVFRFRAIRVKSRQLDSF